MEDSKEKFKIVPFGEDRYAVEQDGKIIDDAQGYGYRTKQGAYKAMYFKINEEKIRRENAIVINFMWNNKSFKREIEQAMFYSYKDNVKLTAEDVEDIAKNNGLELPCPAKKFLSIMMRKTCKW